MRPPVTPSPRPAPGPAPLSLRWLALGALPALLGACDAGAPETAGAITASEAEALEDAADMLDEQQLPPEALPPEATAPGAAPGLAPDAEREAGAEEAG